MNEPAVQHPCSGLRVANFVDSSLLSLEQKGNLDQALMLYNPLGVAEQVFHFTVNPDDTRLQERFTTRRVTVVPFFNRASSAAWRAVMVPAALLRVVRLMRRERVSVVRGRLPYFSSLIGCLAARVLGVPAIVSLGGDNRLAQARQGRYYFGSRALSYGIERAVLMLATRVVVPNEFTRRYLGEVVGAKAAARRAVLVPWIIDGRHVAAAPDAVLARLGIAPDRPFVLVVGHLNAYKFAREMFDVAETVESAHPAAFQMVFCGDGPLRGEGEARASRVRGMRILGWQPNALVRALMARAACVAVPMSGFVLLEAAAAGAPVVAGDIEWHSELVEDGRTGWLVPPEDTRAWAARLIAILTNPAGAGAAGAALQQRFRECCDPQRGLALEAQLYRELGCRS